MAKTSVPRSEKRIVKSFQVNRRRTSYLYSSSDWKREQNRLDPSLQEYLEWLSMDWAEKFEEPHNSERPSYSSWSPSPTWWRSSEVGRNGMHTGGMTTNGQINGKERQYRRYSTSTVGPR